MVFDVPAESGGALTILKQYHDTAVKDAENEWIFVISTPQLIEKSNVKILSYRWIKKSWMHRVFFDRFIAHNLVRKYSVDEVISLQNIVVPNVKVKQTLYLHQPLPFVDKKYKITENFKFWVYQNIISEMIFNSIKKADKVIVQTKWIMDEALIKVNVNKENFILKPPEINIQVKRLYESEKNAPKLFFYPASAVTYKNHEIIIEACRLLKSEGIVDFKVVFTLTGDENKHIKKLRDIIKEEDLSIEFIGMIDIGKVYQYYSKSILIFPSYIETYGLPLLEAKMHRAPVIASNCAFSHEVLDDYDLVEFFDPFDRVQLAHYMRVFIK